MLEKVIESEWDKEDEPFEFEDEEKLLETLVDGTIDIRNTLTRAQVYYQENAHATAPTDNHIQPITNQIEELLDYFPDDFDEETAAVPDEILRFYTALEDLRNRLQQSELTTANLDAGIKRLDETLHAAGYAVIDPDPGSTTDPYRHKVWSKTESELTEGRVVRVREVGYERDGNIKREAKVVVSSGTRPVPETIPSPPRRSFTYEDFDYEEPLGQGGNADVHRATIETDDGRLRLAIKTPRMKGTLHAEAVNQIVDEAKLWQQLDDHDHIVSVVDYGSEPLPWIGMEYMDGGHFGERIAGMDIRQKCWTALAITRAVRHAHDRGVAHLDLKPENILFREVEDAWDPPKVADWGLSKHLLDHSQSVEGISPQYAAPEQFDSEAYGNTDTATDIYQLGAVSYELFTERPPFTGQTFEIVNKIQNEHPAPPSEHADIPAALDEIILKALKRRKADRYEHVLYLRDDLKEVFESI
jgi:molecular chaperone DnaK